MRISKTTHNALQILIETAKLGTRLVKGAAIAHELGLTEQNTSKIVHLLSRGGFIKAVRGPQGGMTLAQNPDDIRVGDVVLAMERMTVEDRRQARGGFNDLFDEALDAFVSVLNEHTLADVARSKRGGALIGLSRKPAKSKGQKAKRKIAAIPEIGRAQRSKATKARGIPK